MPNINNNSKYRIITAVALIVIVLLIISSIFVYYEYFAEEKKVEEKPEILKQINLLLNTINAQVDGAGMTILEIMMDNGHYLGETF